MKICVLLLGVLLLAFGSAPLPAAAQERPLDPNAVPDYGIAAGGAGFQPDPFRVDAVTGGGEVDAAARNLGKDCAGTISVQPDFRFQALTPLPALRFIFIADAVTADAALIVRDANGNFHCSDDSYSTPNPTVEILDPPAGDYNIWVGAVSRRVFGDLYVTTRRDVYPGSTNLIVPRQTPTPTPAPTATPVPPHALNPELAALSGIDALAAGFLPDPYWRVLTGGGGLNVEDSISAPDCVGYTHAAPDFRLNWSGTSTRLRFLFAPLDDDQDSALIVQAPDGSWNCNRDFAGGYTRPQVEFINPTIGAYSVWVSSETGASQAVTGILYVTEKIVSPETVHAAGTAPTTPINGLTPGTSAFQFDAAAPDPYAIPGALAGGSLDVGEQNKDCPGFYSELPAFGFVLPDPALSLRVYFVADDSHADAALIVRMPDGAWYCNDDSFNTRQPTVDIVGNGSTGGMSIWLGSYNADDSISGTLYVTRGSASPLDPTRPAPVIVAP